MTGLVMDSGDGVTHIVPVVDGFSFPHLTKRLNVAGRHITAHLSKLVQQRGHASGILDMESMRCLKERACYVAAHLEREQQVRLKCCRLGPHVF